MNNYLLLLSGKNGSGKTTASNYLKENYDVKNISIASNIKRNFCDIYDINLSEMNEHKNLFRNDWSLEQLKKVDSKLYNKIVNSPVSQYDNMKDDDEQTGLVELSKLMSMLYGNDYWVSECCYDNSNLLNDTDYNIVIDDWRCLFEFKYLTKHIQKKRIYTIRILPDNKRLLDSGYELSDDILETDLDSYNFHYILKNNKSIEEFYEKLDDLMSLLSVRRIKKHG